MGTLTSKKKKKKVCILVMYCNSFIFFFRYLLEQDYPGGRIGPEPTTDCFTALMHRDVEGLIPGNALVMDSNKPFRTLSYFGNTFLNR